jgi:isoleucyl-tRNA synthetase
MYKPLPEKMSFSDMEHSVLDFWDENNIFEKTLEQGKGKPGFTFYEGPPTVNGKPGIHHMMARTIKDAVCRYKTMRGFYVRRQAGWDTHGLPVEIAVEKELGLKDKAAVTEYGIDKFNAQCKDFVYKNINMDQGWGVLTRRMGYWVNLDEAYITCTQNYVESVWWALKTFFDKGLIYKGFKVVPQSPTIGTPLSSHELSLGYKDVRDPNCYLKLKVVDSPMPELNDAYLMVWTTTPWTLLSNVALAAGEDIEYVLVRNKRKIKDEVIVEKLVIAKARMGVLDGETDIIEIFKGSDFIGTVYEQIFAYEPYDRKKYPNALTVLPGEFVTTEDGSGIVHMAPAFGEDDYAMSKSHNLPFVQNVTHDGHFTDNMGEFAGRAIKHFTYADHEEEGSDKDVVIALKIAGKIYRSTNDYLHSYPHCWRTGNPVMYYARESWFIKSPEYKQEMLDNNDKIKWQPKEIGEGRFGNWLKEVKEWSLSRDRFWGSPLPVWVDEDGLNPFAIGSIAELKETGIYIHPDGTREALKDSDIEIDLHRPFVDNIVFERDGKDYHRIPEIVDAWFDSGSVPFAQFHYPFENKELFEENFPCDFIAEGIDQTRGWFYTLHNISTALFGKPAFKNIVVNELILDKKGLKMSKSKGNTVDPFEVMEKYGADAVRWYLFVNNPPWKPTSFNEEDIAKTVIADFFRSLTNTYAFFTLYANIDKFDGTEELIPRSERPEIDRWIISRVNTLLRKYINWMDDFDLTKAHRAIQHFAVNELSNWYIRRNRRRFWKGEKDSDKIAAYQTLKEVMMIMVKMTAPTAPFLAEDLFLKLRMENDPISIHLLDIEEPKKEDIDTELERKMELAQRIVFLSRSLREKSKLRVRQPLQRILVPVVSDVQREDIQYFEDIIKEEINIKEIEFVSSGLDIVKRVARPNFKVIGRKFGKLTQKVSALIKGLTNDQIVELEQESKLIFNEGDAVITLTPDDIEIFNEDIEGWLVASEDNVTVALDTIPDEALLTEGIAREFVNRIQNLRKQSGFEVTDRIKIEVNAPEVIANAIEAKKEYIMNETLASEIKMTNTEDGEKLNINDIELFAKTIKI